VVGAVWVPHTRHEHDVGIGRVDNDAADLLDVAEPDGAPGSSTVHRLEDAVADTEIRTMETLATADINDVRIRRRDGDIAHRSGWRAVEDRMPGPAVVIRLPHAAVVDAHIEHASLRWHAHATDGAARAERSNETVAQLLIEGGIDTVHVTGALRSHDARAGTDQQEHEVSRSHSCSVPP